MKAPMSWLKEYVDIDVSTDELCKKLFSCGFEVEETYKLCGPVDKIVSCRIEKIEKHPNADKLSVCQIDAGKYGKLQIVTNGKNIFEGAIVPVALDGATLYSGDRIFNGEIRGVKSFGMFCSGEELGINDDWYEGASENCILILKENYPLGEEMTELLGLNDVVLDIGLTANRPDCQSILGLAREVAAVLGKPLKMPDLTYKTDKNVSTVKTLNVKNDAFDLCPRYISHYVKDVKIEESPLWMKRRLFSMGLRSISNIVDITNYVLLEIGQPMHAFDLNTLSGNVIDIRRAKDGEKIITLDEKEFELSSDNLVICDSKKPVALAGVMGGLNSEIESNTKEVAFESAKFARDNIRKTARSLGKRTDASSRYEKGVDIYSPEIGMKRALNLIDKMACGTIADDEYDLIEKTPENKVIETTFDKVNGVLGITVPSDKIVEILKSLHFGVEVSGENLKVIVPLYREDMESYPDIAEEVIREYGYDKLVPTMLKTAAITSGGKTDEQKAADDIKDLLVGFGFNEIITYSFVSEKEYDLFGIDKSKEEQKFIKIINPLGEDMAVMRTSLLPSAVRIAANNIKRKNFEGRLFELAKVYNPKSLPLTELPTENTNLSFVVFGNGEDFFTAKGVIEGIMKEFCFGHNVKYVPSERKCLHPTRGAEIYIDGENVGYFGQINPEITQKLDVEGEIYAGEVFYEKLKKYFERKITFKPISKFPIVERDLAVLIDENTPCDVIIDKIKEAGGEFLDSVKLFDVYQGDQVEKGKKSMAFNLIFVSYDRTLNVEEVDDAIKNVLKALRNDLKAELR